MFDLGFCIASTTMAKVFSKEDIKMFFAADKDDYLSTDLKKMN